MRSRRLLFVLLTVVTLAACGAGAEQIRTPALPAGFERVHLGMSLKELRAARTEIRRDDWPYSPMYFERLPAGDASQFMQVGYTFDKKTDRLAQVSFSWSGALPELKRRCGSFVASLEARLGAPDARRIQMIRRHYITNGPVESPRFEWKSDDVIVTAQCVAISDAPKVSNFYDLTISTAAFAATRQAGESRPADAAEFERLFQSLLARSGDAPEFR